MSDYIKREDAIKAIREIYDNAWDAVDADDMFRDGLVESRKAVELVPSADVVEVRHGRWLIGVNGVICSECEQLARFSWNYCPVCGARMDGKDQSDKEYEDSILAAQKSEE